MAAPVISVERLTITLTGASGSASLTKGQVIANCVPMCSGSHDATSDGNDDNWIHLDIVSGPNRVTATRVGTGGTVVVEVDVIEFNPAEVTVQKGTFVIASSGTTVDATITAVTIANTWLYAGAQCPVDNTLGTVLIDYFLFNTTTVRFTRGFSDADAVTGTFWAVEAIAGAWTVQHNTFTIADNATTASVTLTAVTMARTWNLLNWQASIDSDDPDFNLITGVLTTTTNYTATRYNGTSAGALPGRLQSIEMAVGTTVQRDSIVMADNVATGTASITSCDMTKCSLNPQGQPTCGTGVGRCDSGFGPDQDGSWAALTFDDSTTVRATRGAASDDEEHTTSFEAIDWDKVTNGPIDGGPPVQCCLS